MKRRLTTTLVRIYLLKSLHHMCYNRHPSFRQFIISSGLPFKPHNQFKQEDILARQILYTEICKKIWATEGFDEIANALFLVSVLAAISTFLVLYFSYFHRQFCQNQNILELFPLRQLSSLYIFLCHNPVFRQLHW